MENAVTQNTLNWKEAIQILHKDSVFMRVKSGTKARKNVSESFPMLKNQSMILSKHEKFLIILDAQYLKILSLT